MHVYLFVVYIVFVIRKVFYLINTCETRNFSGIRPVATNLPIILAHGITPFDRVIHPFINKDNQPDDSYHYFRKIRSTLISHGFHTFHSRVAWADSLERRAADLREEILRLTENFSRWPGIHIIAHSMGGLDARLMLHRYRMEQKIASLTTIGTPHLGTSYADWGLRRFGVFIDLARPLGVNLAGFKNLTREKCRQLNDELEEYEHNNGVIYRTIAGAQPRERVYMPLRLSHWIVEREEGENDGVVSVASAMWKKEYFLEKIDADHFNQLGWWDRSEAKSGIDRETFEQNMRDLYVRIASGLKD